MFKITRKKIAASILLLVLTYSIVAAIGIKWISSSPALPIAEQAVRTTLGEAETRDTHIQFNWWNSWAIGEESGEGTAHFTLCAIIEGKEKRCFEIYMKQTAGQWMIIRIAPKN